MHNNTNNSGYRYHVDPKSGLKRGKTDMYVHVVDMESNTIMQPEKILKVVDANYDYLSIYYEEAGIMSILLAEEVRKESTGFWDPNLAALLALILVLFLGIIMFSIVCCCVKPWIFNAHANKPKKLREGGPSPNMDSRYLLTQPVANSNVRLLRRKGNYKLYDKPKIFLSL